MPEARTGEDGRFVLRDMPAGTRQLEALGIGMMPRLLTVDVRPLDTAVVELQLRQVTSLDVVKVVGARRYERVAAELEQRRKLGLGYIRDSSEIKHYPTMSSVFDGVFPNVHVRAGIGSHFVVTLPGNHSTLAGAVRGTPCVAILWIDGVPAFYDELDALNAANIAAIEVYPDFNRVPPQFMRQSITERTGPAPESPGDCGAVVVWTKRYFP